MAILPPPFIQEKLPSQYKNGNTLVLSFPFMLNRAVGEGDFSALQLKVKTVSTNIIVDTVPGSYNYKDNNYIAQFEFQKILTEGQFYKAQIAFISKDNDIGDFSTVGIFKYTAKPKVILLNSDKKEYKDFESISNVFVGGFQTTDVTEKIAEYRFQIFSEDNVLFNDSGFLTHNIENDNNKDGFGNPISIDSYTLKKELDSYKNYYIIYTVKTINNLIVSSRQNWFRPPSSVSIGFPGKLQIKTYGEDGYLSVQVMFNQTKSLSGSFKILRSNEYSNFIEWDTIYYLNFANKITYNGEILELFRDYTLEQGVKYKYAIQQYQGNLSVTKIMCDTLIEPNGKARTVDYFYLNYEDMFLYDGKRSLKIKFNPKISSFKNNILESKIDTIGNKYPTFFRNGIVNYKTFPISGLISRLMDENRSFLVEENTPNNNFMFSTDLTYDNIKAEREFKLKVLEWLTNGKPKLFKSPVEGNYIVRLMNISLSPNDTLGRMLNTFNCEAYEIAEYTFDNLLKQNLFDDNIHYIEDVVIDNQKLLDENILPGAIQGTITNATFGDIYNLTFLNGDTSKIAIGYTGTYEINADKENPLIKITTSSNNNNAYIQYSYLDKSRSELLLDKDNKEMVNFKTFNKIEQFIGTCNIYNSIVPEKQNTLILQIENIPFVRIQQKLVEPVFVEGEKFYQDKISKIEIQPKKTVLYYNQETKEYYILNKDKMENIGSAPKYDYQINNKSFILESGRIELNLTGNEKITKFDIGNGLYADVFYYGSSYELKE